MVKSFQFARTPRILFGNGTISELPGLLNAYGNDVLLVTGTASFMHSQAAEYLLNTMELTGIRYHHLTINREPSPEMIDNAVIRYRDLTIRVVVAIGGGSVMDAGKAIAAMLCKQESVKDFLEGVGHLTHPGTTVPLIAVPTTAGTGSETTKNAVISEVGPQGYKKSLRHDNFVPAVAIVDPELMLNCPPALTASSGMDCFTQLVESYLSVKATAMTDALALDGLRELAGSLEIAWRMGQNIEARSSMAYAAMLSGICLANAGLGAVHGFASSVGGMFNIPHGTLCGTLMLPANRITVTRLRENDANPLALKKYAALGRIFAQEQDKPDEYYTDLFLEKVGMLTETLNIDRLGKYGITRTHTSAIIRATDIKTHPVHLVPSDLEQILLERL